VGSYNDGGYFDDIEVLTGEASPLLAPDDLRIEVVSDDRINLSWRDRSDNEEGFRIERKREGESFLVIGTVGANVTKYSDSGLEGSTRYNYRICSMLGSELSAYSNVVSGTTLSEGGSGGGSGDIAKKMVAHWKFDETGGSTASDASGNGHHGILENGVSFTSAKYSRGILLDGEDDRVSAGTFDIPDGEGLTIATL